jgi:hypothetical protein
MAPDTENIALPRAEGLKVAQISSNGQKFCRRGWDTVPFRPLYDSTPGNVGQAPSANSASGDRRVARYLIGDHAGDRRR